MLAGVADDPGDQVEIREDAEADVYEESSKVDFLKCPGRPRWCGLFLQYYEKTHMNRWSLENVESISFTH